jgi:hypothetical protein
MPVNSGIIKILSQVRAVGIFRYIEPVDARTDEAQLYLLARMAVSQA